MAITEHRRNVQVEQIRGLRNAADELRQKLLGLAGELDPVTSPINDLIDGADQTLGALRHQLRMIDIRIVEQDVR